MTRDEAIKALKPCGGGHWQTGATCDSCWVNEHRCPPALLRMAPAAIRELERAAKIGQDAQACIQKLRELGLETTR